VTPNADGSYTLTGTQLTGFVTTGEDDLTMAENYPIVYLTDAAGHVYYARSFNFSSMVPTQRGEVQTAQFTLPMGLPYGNYNLYVSAVGISSGMAYPFTPVPSPPVITFVGSAATGTSPLAAGQLISIYGTQLGPPLGSAGQVGPNGVLTNANGGTQVLFDGVASPILFARTDIVNSAIPCALAGHTSTQLVVEYMGVPSAPMTIPLSPVAPSIFTANSSGIGQGLVFNLPAYSLNGPNNPALRGTEVFFYSTGLGPMSPACVDGEIYQSNFPTATLQVVAGVGTLGAPVLYAGQAPDLMAGVAQINIVVPNDAPTGVVPLTLLVNGVFSPSGVTIAVK
jgi:uncharacterized protein (TIGR03437 family)